MSVGSQRASDRASAELVELGCSTCDGQTTAGTRTARGATGEPGAAPRHGKALSEDLDLIALAPRRDVAAALDKLLPRGASRATGVLRWNPSLAVVKEADAASLEGPHGIRLRVQLLRDEGYAPWPTEQRSLHQRYADAPPATLSVPTRAAFAAGRRRPGRTVARRVTCGICRRSLTLASAPGSSESTPSRSPPTCWRQIALANCPERGSRGHRDVTHEDAEEVAAERARRSAPAVDKQPNVGGVG